MIWCLSHGEEATLPHTDRRRNPTIRNSPCDPVEITEVEQAMQAPEPRLYQLIKAPGLVGDRPPDGELWVEDWFNNMDYRLVPYER